MSLIPVVGRRSPKMRLLLAFIYLLLTLGAVTTVYPFLVMISASLSSDYDQDAYNIVPHFLFSDSELATKYAEDKYNADLTSLNRAYGSNFATLQTVSLIPDQNARKLVPKWRKFFNTLGPNYRVAAFRGTRGQFVPSKLLDRYRDWLRVKYDNNIQALSQAYTEEDTTFLSVFPPFERPLQRFYSPAYVDPKSNDWLEFQKSLPEAWFQPVLCDPLYQSYLHDEAFPTGKIADLNSAWGTSFSDWNQITLPPTIPTNPAEAKTWSDFAHRKLPLRFITWIDPVLASKYGGNKSLPTGPELRRYAAFVATANPKLIRIESAENLWRAQTSVVTPLPLAEDDREYALANKQAIRSEFISRNYKFALDFLLLHGSGIWNTVIYCAGAVLAALIINPLCAYALSRFKLPYAGSLLLFLLGTMAFPAEITMIPNFLLIKQLGLLNTFWALILPGAASGYSIFLLKGFFDSLPQELYEAGMLDGASDLVLFTRVTLPLSGPIFAVIALNSFTAAYGAFLFAMIVAQAQDHWTLMVWIYQFQALSAPQYVIMAALVIAALPTLIVFLFAQNVIMKGIILPSYK